MISKVSQSFAFTNSFATSFQNLGVISGTTVGGWMIVTQGVIQPPWIGLGFRMPAFLMIAIRSMVERQKRPSELRPN